MPSSAFHLITRVGYHRSWRQQLLGMARPAEAGTLPDVLPCAGIRRICRALRKKYADDPRHAEYARLL